MSKRFKFKPTKRDEDDPDGMTNEQRAQNAEFGVEAACRSRGEAVSIDYESIRDLIADLGHLCDRNGLSFVTIAADARKDLEGREMNTQLTETIKLVTFYQGGDRVYCTNKTTRQGYGTPEKPHAAAGLCIPDGTPVVDNRAAVETDTGYAWMVAGPMLEVDLPDGETDPCPEPSEVMMQGLQGAFKTLATLHVAAHAEKTTGPLDFVGIATWMKGWKEHGARIGHYLNNQIVWEN